MKRLLVLTAVAATAMSLLTLAPANAAENYNEYNTTLPEFVVGPTPFEVQVDGPYPVCSMTFQGATVTSAPWAFTYEPSPSRSNNYRIDIAYCDGENDSTYVNASPAYEFSSDYVGAQESETTSGTLVIGNNTPAGAKVVITDGKGAVLVEQALPPEETTAVTIPLKGIKHTTADMATVTGDTGLVMQHPITVARGWTMLMDQPTFPPCSALTWYYNPAGQPKGAKGMQADITHSLARLSKETGLTFTQTAERDGANITYGWKNMGKNGPSGLGGPSWSSSSGGSAHVDFNTKDWWVLDKMAGLGGWKGYGQGPGGRGWLIIHETMHGLAFGHVDSRVSIMGPINYGAHAFDQGDLEGLHTLYPKAGCAA